MNVNTVKNVTVCTVIMAIRVSDAMITILTKRLANLMARVVVEMEAET